MWWTIPVVEPLKGGRGGGNLLDSWVDVLPQIPLCEVNSASCSVQLYLKVAFSDCTTRSNSSGGRGWIRATPTKWVGVAKPHPSLDREPEMAAPGPKLTSNPTVRRARSPRPPSEGEVINVLLCLAYYNATSRLDREYTKQGIILITCDVIYYPR